MSVRGGGGGGATFPINDDLQARVRGNRDADHKIIDFRLATADASRVTQTLEAPDVWDFLNDLNDLVAVVNSMRFHVEWDSEGDWFGASIAKGGNPHSNEPGREDDEVKVFPEQLAYHFYYGAHLFDDGSLGGEGGDGFVTQQKITPTWPNLFLWSFDDDDQITVAANQDDSSTTNLNVRWILEYFIAEVEPR